MGAGKLHKPGILRNEVPVASVIAADAEVPDDSDGGQDRDQVGWMVVVEVKM